MGEVVSGKGAARTKLDRTLASQKLPEERDRALLTDLVYGTMRHLATLDQLLEELVERGLDRVSPEVLAILRVGAYQLVFSDHVPAAVAVSEAVESVRAQHLRGFVNGTLRSLGRLVVKRMPEDAPPEGVPPSRRLPGRERGWVVLAQDVLPDAAREPDAWLAAATAHPIGLVRRWLARFGFDATLETCRAGNAPPPLCLRVNRLATTREAILDELAKAGIEARAGELPFAVYAKGAGDVGRLACIRDGRVSVQDETAMRPSELLAPATGERVLDLCAAPGGKTTHLAELMGDDGLVVATDASGSRLDRVRENVERLHLKSVKVLEPSEELSRDPFDAVLVDVPCSNTGVLRRRVEVRGRVDALERAPLLALQRDLLRKALAHVHPGGRVVYSTCSIEPEENEQQVRALLTERPGLELRREELTLPRRGGGDGGYAALLVANATV